jgi:hypothetical protein
MGTWGSFSGIRAAGRDVDQTHLPGPVIKYSWSFITTPAIGLYRVEKKNYRLHKEMLSFCPTPDVRRDVNLVFLLYFI